MQNSVKPEKLLFMIAAIAIVLGAMRVASGVLVPGLLALFIAIVCTEPMYWLTEKGLPRWLAILLVVIVLLGVSSTIPLVVSGSIVQFNQQLPIYQERLDELMFQSSGWLQQFGYTAESLQTIFDPSGEMSTEVMRLLWALAFSLFSSSVAAWEGRKRQFKPRRGHSRPKTHPNPRL